MNVPIKVVHIYRCGDVQFVVALILLSDDLEMETMPIYTSSLGNRDDLAHHLEMAYAAAGVIVPQAINPWQTDEGRELSEAEAFCVVSWMPDGVYLSPQQLIIDEIDGERGWMELSAAVVKLGASPTYHDIALEVIAHLQ